jgi:predicted DNA-binding protein YlxM (UPF0122 family)
MEMMLWNIVLSLFVGIVSWVLREKSTELHRIQILLNRTREEIAKEYVTKAEVHADINRVILRLDKIDEKLDRFVERHNA